MKDSINSKSINPWAILSFAFSLGICPLFSMFSFLFGFRALVEIRSNPFVRGKKFALAGLIISSIITLLWVSFGFWWHLNVRKPLFNGPALIINSAVKKDFDQFFDLFGVINPSVQQLEMAENFIDSVQERWGDLVAVKVDTKEIQNLEESEEPLILGLIPYSGHIEYILEFENERVSARAEYLVANLEENSFKDFLLYFNFLDIGDQDTISFYRSAK